MSALPTLIGCPTRVVLQSLELISDSSGAAADTGSALHHMAASFHVGKHKKAKALARAAKAKEFPLADIEQAEKWYDSYSADSRNAEAEILGVEQSVTVALEPASHDSTGELIYLTGRCDQIRRDRNIGVRVVDIKTGRSAGVAAIEQAAYQLAGYTVGVAKLLGLKVMAPPAILRVRGYDGAQDASTAPVYFQSFLSWERCLMLIDEIRNTIADVRNGRVDVRPGFACSTICPARGLQNCLALLERI